MTVPPRRRLAAVLWWIEMALFAVGAAAGAWFLFVQADAAIANRRDRARLSAMMARAAAAVPDAGAARRPDLTPAVVTGSPIGELSLSRVGLSAVVRQGDSDEVLRLGAGHIPGTAFPGERGNVGIAGHRDTIFRPLRLVHAGDLITLVTPAGRFRYRVAWTRTVTPSDVAVLAPTRAPSLTLVTCYPFYFIGHAPQRFVVRAVEDGAANRTTAAQGLARKPSGSIF